MHKLFNPPDPPVPPPISPRWGDKKQDRYASINRGKGMLRMPGEIDCHPARPRSLNEILPPGHTVFAYAFSYLCQIGLPVSVRSADNPVPYNLDEHMP